MVVPGTMMQGYAPRRSVPPLSISSLWSGMKSMTLCVLLSSNSPELASARPADVARKLDDRDLHTQADAEVGDVVRRGRTARPAIMPSMPRLPKPPGTIMPSQPPSSFSSTLLSRDRLGVDPLDVHLGVRRHSPRGAAPPPRRDRRRAAGHTCPRGRWSRACCGF